MNKILLNIAGASLIWGSITMGVMAQSTTSTSSRINTACAKTAIDKREDAIKAAVDKLAADFKTAVDARRTTLKAALDLTDRKAMNEAERRAWQSFMEARHAARKTYNASRKSAWSTFRKEARACGSKGRGGESHDGEVDEL